MYFETVQQYAKTLRNLSSVLDKAQKHAEARKFDPNNYLTARLAPDMFPFVRQVQSVCDIAKFTAARLSGQEAPRHEDSEKSLDELKQRIGKCLTYLDSFKPEHFQGAAERRITLPRIEGKYLLGKDYLLGFAVPNFYFHAAMVYALLRHAGVEVGKMDFLGDQPLHAA